jgi:PPOX class probable F420-dependent enzyme
MLTIDTSTGFGARAQRRLADETVGWLVTVDPSGTPQPTPVWFLRSGDDLLVSSQPRTAKLRNIAANPRAALHLNSTESGGNVIVVTGAAAVDPDGMTADERSSYDEKYRAAIKGLGMTNDEFHADYSVVVRITADKLRGF